MKSKVLKIFFILLIVLTSYTKCHRPCGSGFLKTHRVLTKPPDENTRYLKEDVFEPIRVHWDFSFIENNIGKFDRQDLIDLKERIMPKTAEVFQNLLKVRRLKTKLRFQETMCEQYPIPDKYEINGDGVDADIVIFVIIDDTGFFLQNRIEAAAIHCLQHSETKRPIAGYIQFKPQIGVGSDQTALDYMVWLALHELTHVFAFNDGLYQDFIDEDLNPIGENAVLEKRSVSGRSVTFIKSPNVVAKAREHFGCDNILGVPLEYNGGPGTAGAHWAKRFMNTDYMIGDSYGENLFSPITLALFIDSGWYKVDYNMSNLFLWGKNEGCGFMDFSKKCINGGSVNSPYAMTTPYKTEFCTNFNKQVCSTSNIFRGRCMVKRFERDLPATDQFFDEKNVGGIDPLTEHCPIVIEEKNGENYYGGSCRVGSKYGISDYETVGPTSACFMSSLHIKGEGEYVDDDVVVDEKRKNAQKVELPNMAAKFRFLSKKNNLKQIPKNSLENITKQNEIKKEIQINQANKEKVTDKTNIVNNSNKKAEISKITNKVEKAEKPKAKENSKDVKVTENTNKNNQLKKAIITKSDKKDSKINNQNIHKESRIKVTTETFNTKSDYKSACLKFSCENGRIQIHIKGNKIPCAADGNNTNIPGYLGNVICPPSEVLCIPSFMCKFGCIEKYHDKR